MANVKAFYDPNTEVLTIFWQEPRKAQFSEELGDGAILIRDEKTNEVIGVELLSYRPGDERLNAVSVEIGQPIVV